MRTSTEDWRAGRRWGRPARRVLLLGLFAPLAGAPAAVAQTAADAGTSVSVDERSRTVTVTIAPLTIPVTGDHHAAPKEPGKKGRKKRGMGGHDSPFYRATWPIEAWLYGFSIELYDAAGRRLPRKHLHHVSVVNLSRRQLVLPAFERLLGAGQEQSSFEAPRVIGVPMEPGMELGAFIGWHNDTGAEIAGASLVIRMQWTPPNMKPSPTEVLPVWLDVGYRPGKSDSYDLPPGPSSRAFEFTVPASGRILAAGGHMHDYGKFVRLEEVEGGKVLFSIDAKLDADGKLVEMPRRIFGARGEGIRLHAGKRYRLRVDYDSPVSDTLKSGAMGIMALLYRPDDLADWPKVDPADPDLQVDLTWLETMGIPKSDQPADGHDKHQH